MRLHVLHDEVLLSVDDGSEPAPGLSGLLDDLSFLPAAGEGANAASCRISVRRSTVRATTASAALGNGLATFDRAGVACVTDGASVLQIRMPERRAVACLAGSFGAQPAEVRHRFWAFGILKLLRSLGFFGLHAAAASTPEALNLLIAGPSGCGKSTATLNLIRAGGSFLSDDAILIREDEAGVEALALRKPFSVCAKDVAACADVCHVRRAGAAPAHKRRADAQSAYPGRHVRRFRPHAMVFPILVQARTSTLRPLDPAEALNRLLAQSGAELFDAPTMPLHLRTMSHLVRQARPYELLAGSDVHRSPAALLAALEGARRGLACRASLSN